MAVCKTKVKLMGLQVVEASRLADEFNLISEIAVVEMLIWNTCKFIQFSLWAGYIGKTEL